MKNYLFSFSTLLTFLLADVAISETLPTVGLSQPILIAQGQRQSPQQRQQQSRGRQRHLTGEARTSSAKTNIDFEAAAIDGERRAPVGVAIGSNKPDHEYDLINLRLRWHPEMIKSTSNLETGRGR